MNNMSMKESCVSASEKCVCTRRSEVNKILHVAEGENAQLVRLRTKDNVFIAWLYDGEEGTLFYPAFKVDEGKLPDITEILAADEVKPDTAFFCYRTGEYYYLFAEGEEKDDNGYKWKDISDTEIMQIVVFANERLVWQIFNKSNYPEIPSSPIIEPFLFEVNGEYKPFWFVQIQAFFISTNLSAVREKINDSWLKDENLQRFWNFTTSDTNSIKQDEGKVDINTMEDVVYTVSESIVKGIFIPVFWGDNTTARDNSADFFRRYKIVKSLERFGLYSEYDEKTCSTIHISTNPMDNYESHGDKYVYYDINLNRIVIDKSFAYNDSYLSFSWNDTLGLYLINSKKPRLYFLKSNNASLFSKEFKEYKFQSVEELSFRHYLRWSDSREREKAVDAYIERNGLKKQEN